jgi:predicted phage terminase large subunit-like protein
MIAHDETPPGGRPIRLTFNQFVWLWNQLQDQDTPALHQEIAAWLGRGWDESQRRLLLLVFRDAGKSTLVGLYCAWLLSQDPDLRILVLSAEHSLAGKMVRNVKRIIERHPVTRRLVPERPDQWAADRFTVRRRRELRDPSLLARGVAGNITGTRAEVVICDDVEVPNTCDTPGKRAELRERLGEIGFVLVPDGQQLYVGTPHSFYSIYAEEPRHEQGETRPFLHGFQRLVLPLVDEDGRSRWPERFTADKIEELCRESGPQRFASQMLLRPTNIAEVRLEPDLLRRYEAPLACHESNGRLVLTIGGRRMVSASCYWDPSFGAPDRGDRSAVAVVFVDEEGGYWLQGLAYLTHDPAAPQDEATQLCRQVADFALGHEVPVVTVESNGLGRFLPSLLRAELGRRGSGATVREHSASRNKERRILEALDPVMAAGRLHVHADVWRTPFIEEMREWQPGRRCRDDGLDAVAGCLLGEPVRLPPVPPSARSDWRPGQKPLQARSDFRV